MNVVKKWNKVKWLYFVSVADVCYTNVKLCHMCHTVWLVGRLGEALAGGDTHGVNVSSSKTKCEGRKTLDACLKQLPPILDQAEMIGIPSTKKDVEASCR
jgi:hypothetical protein